MSTWVRTRSATVPLGLAVMLTALWALAGATPIGLLRGAGITSAVGCVLCVGGGIAALSSGSIAWVLWSGQGSAVAGACLATCIAAVT